MDAAPAQLGDVDHTINAADIDKCAVAGQGLDGAVILLADLDLVPDVLDALAALSLCNTADGADNTLACLVDLGDLEADSLLEQLCKISLAGQIGLGCGNEHAHALDIDDNAALVLFGDNAFENGLVIDSFFNCVPHLGSVKTLLGEHCGAFDIVDSDNNSFDSIADLDSIFDLDAVIGELGSRNEAGILGAQINTDLGAGNSNNNAGYLISIIYSFESLLQHFIEGLFLLNCGFFNFDFVAHFVSYLLNYPRRGGCTGRESHCVSRFQPVHIKGIRPLYKLYARTMLPAYLCKMHTVRAVPAADDNHGVTIRGKPGRLLLTRGRSKAYCIRYFRICTSFFYNIATFGKITVGLRRLNDKCYGFFPIARIFIQPLLEFCRIFKHFVLPAPAADGLDLGVVAHTDDNGEAVFLLGGGDDLMYGFHLGAGRVMYHGSGLLEFLVHLRRRAVRAD